MSFPVDELITKTTVDISEKILNLFGNHPEEAMSFDDIADVLLGEFDIEKVNAWRPYSGMWIYRNVRKIYNRLSIVTVALAELVSAGKLKTFTVEEDLNGPLGGISHFYESYYALNGTR